MCPRCGAAGRPDDRYCAACGTPVPPDAAPRHAVSGARKLVTVLFADIVGSTSLIEHVDPEDAVARLQPVLDAMAAAVHAFGGTVSAMMGDGVLALFGAPVAHEDHAVRAAYAALRMLADVETATGAAIDIRVGLHTGEVLVRTVTTDLSHDYTALGPPVHLASRMERMARPGQVLLTAQTARMAEGFIETEAQGPVAVRGMDDPVEVHRLVGRTSAVGTWMPRVQRQLTRFVGRDRELATVREALTHARGGRGRLTAVVGEAGVGKSRLIHEFVSGLPAGVTVRRLQASPYDVSTPYHPLVPLFGGAPAEAGEVGGAAVRDRVTTAVAAIDPSAEPAVIDPLVAMVGGQPDSPAWVALDPPRRRRRIRDAARTVIAGSARRATQVIVVEDLHWIDEDTQAVLNDIADAARDAAIHLVVTYRPEYTDAWIGRPDHDQVHLDQLRGAAAVQLVTALLGDDPSVARLRRALVSRTGGTPLFIEEAVRSLADDGALTGAPGAYRLVGDPELVSLPDTVQAVVAARVDRLPHDDKQLLQTASVFGETVPIDVLTSTSGLERHVVAEAVTRLRAAEFVYGLSSRRALTFKHNLIREVVYGEIPLERRRALHGAVADVLMQHDAAADAPIERLAHHAHGAERWEDAVRYLWQAAARAEQRSAYPQAQRFLTMGLEAAAHLDDAPEHLIRRIDMAGALRAAATGSGRRLHATLSDLDRAVTLAEALGDRPRHAMTEVHRSYVGSLTGDHHLAVTAARTAQRLGAELADRYLLAEGRLAEGQALVLAGSPATVPELLEPDIDYLRTAIGSDRRGLTTTRVVTSLTFLPVAYAQLGRFADARRMLAERTAIAQAGGRPFDLAFGGWSAGTIEVLAGRPAAARGHFEEGLEIARLHDLLYVDALIGAHLGGVQALLGEPAAALRTLGHASGFARLMQSDLIVAWADAHRAQAQLLLGQRSAARDAATAALTFARARGHPLLEATSLRWLAAATRDRGAADAHLLAALDVCDRVHLAAIREQVHRDRAALAGPDS